LVQSIVFSVIQDNPYKWIICEGLSEKIYFEEIFKDELEKKNLRILPLGSFKEVRKVYYYLQSPIKDPDYNVKGKIICLIDTDNERVEVDYQKSKSLYFDRLMNNLDGTILVDVDSNQTSPPTEIQDCLNPILFYQTLMEFSEENERLKVILTTSVINDKAKNSFQFLDLRESERKTIKEFFDENKGYNKIRFARKYVELSKLNFFSDCKEIKWINDLKKRINN